MDELAPKIRFARSKPDDLGQRLRELSKASAKAAARLRRNDNVVSVTIGEKRTGGQQTGRLSLVFHVSRKGGTIATEDLIPPTVDLGNRNAGLALPTDVVELGGLPRTLGARAGDTVWSADGDYGTTCLTFIKNGRGYVTTNAHVVANIEKGRFYLPNVMRPANGPASLTLGVMAYMSPFSPGQYASEDLAILETTAVGVDHLGLIGETHPIARVSGFEVANSPYWYDVNGMRIGLAEPQPSPQGVPTPMLVDGIWYPYVNFWRLRVTKGQVEHGHSGAVICRGSGDHIQACGILFGGVLPAVAYAFELLPAFKRAYGRI